MSVDFPAFALSEEHEALRESVRALADDKIAPRAAEVDRTGEFPWDVYEALVKADLQAVHIPEAYGGAASDRCDRLHPRCQAAVRTSPDWRQVRAGHDVHPWRAGHRRDLRTGLSAQSFTPASEFVGIIRAAVLVPRV